jgi:hypothetical protein
VDPVTDRKSGLQGAVGHHLYDPRISVVRPYKEPYETISSIHFPSMPSLHNINYKFLISDLIKNAIIPHTYPAGVIRSF